MEPLKIDEFYSYKFLSQLRWAPDGKKAAFVMSECDVENNGYKSYLYLIEDGKTRKLSGMGKEASFFWEDDTHVLFPAARTPAEQKRSAEGDMTTSFYRLSICGGEAEKAFELPIPAKELFKTEDGRFYFFSPIIPACPDVHLMTPEEKAAKVKEIKDNADYIVLEEYPFWFNGDTHIESRRIALFIYDPADRSVKRVTEPKMSVSSAAVCGGKIWFTGAAYDKVMQVREGVYVCDLKDLSVSCVREAGKDVCSEIMRYRDGLALLMTENAKNIFNLTPDFWYIDPKTCEFTMLAKDFYGVANSSCTDCHLGGGYGMKVCGDDIYFTGTVRNATWLRKATADGKIVSVVEKEGSADFFDITDDGKIIMAAMYDGKLQELYSVEGGEVKQLTDFNEKVLEGKYVADYEKLTIRSEGEEIDGWILKPIDYDPAKRYPAVMDIHGGPRAAYGEVFYHEMQYWAGQGYFVFFCNPIGADGRGDEFADIAGKYGTVDFRNFMDFTDAVLARYPQIDKDKVAVTGGSYGGFSTNWIIGHTDRFCCAATQRSISNWVSMYGCSDIGIEFAPISAGSTIFDDPDNMWEHSPLAYANKFTTPTLIIHSDMDYRCPISEGYQLYTALKHKGVEARMVVFKGENHELSRSGKPTHRLRRLTEISNWFEKHCR